MGDVNVDILKDNNQAKEKKRYYISWVNSNSNHNLVKISQKLVIN
jgi:hypothetical protein